MKKWDDINYQKIINVKVNEDILEVTFSNGDVASIPVDGLILPGTLNYYLNDINFNDYEIIIKADPSDIFIPWDKIRVISDTDFSKEMVQKADENAVLVGMRIKSLREKKNIKSFELAERAGIAPQTITRIEKGHTDVNFKTLKKILVAMGCSLKDLATEEIAAPLIIKERSLDFILNKLKAAGLERSLLTKIIPNSIITGFSRNKEPLPELVFNEVSMYLRRIFGWSNEEILSDENLAIDYSPANIAYFKTPSTANIKSIKAYSYYAYYIANLVNSLNLKEPRVSYPEDLDDFKAGFFKHYDTLELDNLINYAWDMGISVIPLNDSGIFHGASWNINDKHVIVLKQKNSSHARWIFDLLHEIYHVFAHLDKPNSSVIEIEEPNPFSNDTPEEAEANYFANQFIFGKVSEQLALESLEKAEYRLELLKNSVTQVAKSKNIRPDFIANYLAFRIQYSGKNWWGVANGFQVTNPSPFEITTNILKQRIEFNSLNPIDKNQLQYALSN